MKQPLPTRVSREEAPEMLGDIATQIAEQHTDTLPNPFDADRKAKILMLHAAGMLLDSVFSGDEKDMASDIIEAICRLHRADPLDAEWMRDEWFNLHAALDAAALYADSKS